MLSELSIHKRELVSQVPMLLSRLECVIDVLRIVHFDFILTIARVSGRIEITRKSDNDDDQKPKLRLKVVGLSLLPSKSFGIDSLLFTASLRLEQRSEAYSTVPHLNNGCGTSRQSQSPRAPKRKRKLRSISPEAPMIFILPLWCEGAMKHITDIWICLLKYNVKERAINILPRCQKIVRTGQIRGMTWRQAMGDITVVFFRALHLYIYHHTGGRTNKQTI